MQLSSPLPLAPPPARSHGGEGCFATDLFITPKRRRVCRSVGRQAGWGGSLCSCLRFSGSSSSHRDPIPHTSSLATRTPFSSPSPLDKGLKPLEREEEKISHLSILQVQLGKALVGKSDISKYPLALSQSIFFSFRHV